MTVRVIVRVRDSHAAESLLLHGSGNRFCLGKAIGIRPALVSTLLLAEQALDALALAYWRCGVLRKRSRKPIGMAFETRGIVGRIDTVGGRSVECCFSFGSIEGQEPSASSSSLP